MDLQKMGELLRHLRKNKGMTQKEVAEKLGVVPKTVSKWETGHGFPDVAVISCLADVLGVSERMLLSGDQIKNTGDVGNMKRTKFFVCEHCGSIMQGTGNASVVCCGKPLTAMQPKKADATHELKLTEIDDEFYVELNHEMTKEHYISFVSYVRFDRVLTVRLYPEQDCAVHIPRMYGGKIVYYCNQHGLYEYQPTANKKA